MIKKSAQSLGGIAYGKIQRERAIENYYKSPNICKNCGKVIEVKENQTVAAVRKNKFCSQSCGAKYSNKNRPKRLEISEGNCENCNKIIIYKKLKNGRYKQQRFCAVCLSTHYLSIKLKLGRSLNSGSVGKYTKKHLFDIRKDWNSARSSISKHARVVYKLSGKPYKCEICNYSIHVDICHKKQVSEFPDDALIEEINDISNLITLCKNHHWELDNGFLKL